jgi:aromatic ring hydroxylase
MKTREGFVSNSSTTSFCIYGVCISRADINGKTAEPLYDKEDMLDIVAFENKLELYRSPDNSNVSYIGISWQHVGDDETGRQFKQRIEDSVKKFTYRSCTTYKEAWYDG